MSSDFSVPKGFPKKYRKCWDTVAEKVKKEPRPLRLSGPITALCQLLDESLQFNANENVIVFDELYNLNAFLVDRIANAQEAEFGPQLVSLYRASLRAAIAQQNPSNIEALITIFCIQVMSPPASADQSCSLPPVVVSGIASSLDDAFLQIPERLRDVLTPLVLTAGLHVYEGTGTSVDLNIHSIGNKAMGRVDRPFDLREFLLHVIAYGSPRIRRKATLLLCVLFPPEAGFVNPETKVGLPSGYGSAFENVLLRAVVVALLTSPIPEDRAVGMNICLLLCPLTMENALKAAALQPTGDALAGSRRPDDQQLLMTKEDLCPLLAAVLHALRDLDGAPIEPAIAAWLAPAYEQAFDLFCQAILPTPPPSLQLDSPTGLVKQELTGRLKTLRSVSQTAQFVRAAEMVIPYWLETLATTYIAPCHRPFDVDNDMLAHFSQTFRAVTSLFELVHPLFDRSSAASEDEFQQNFRRGIRWSSFIVKSLHLAFPTVLFLQMMSTEFPAGCNSISCDVLELLRFSLGADTAATEPTGGPPQATMPTHSFDVHDLQQFLLKLSHMYRSVPSASLSAPFVELFCGLVEVLVLEKRCLSGPISGDEPFLLRLFHLAADGWARAVRCVRTVAGTCGDASAAAVSAQDRKQVLSLTQPYLTPFLWKMLYPMKAASSQEDVAGLLLDALLGTEDDRFFLSCLFSEMSQPESGARLEAMHRIASFLESAVVIFSSPLYWYQRMHTSLHILPADSSETPHQHALPVMFPPSLGICLLQLLRAYQSDESPAVQTQARVLLEMMHPVTLTVAFSMAERYFLVKMENQVPAVLQQQAQLPLTAAPALLQAHPVPLVSSVSAAVQSLDDTLGRVLGFVMATTRFQRDLKGKPSLSVGFVASMLEMTARVRHVSHLALTAPLRLALIRLVFIMLSDSCAGASGSSFSDLGWVTDVFIPMHLRPLVFVSAGVAGNAQDQQQQQQPEKLEPLRDAGGAAPVPLSVSEPESLFYQESEEVLAVLLSGFQYVVAADALFFASVFGQFTIEIFTKQLMLRRERRVQASLALFQVVQSLFESVAASSAGNAGIDDRSREQVAPVCAALIAYVADCFSAEAGPGTGVESMLATLAIISQLNHHSSRAVPGMAQHPAATSAVYPSSAASGAGAAAVDSVAGPNADGTGRTWPADDTQALDAVTGGLKLRESDPRGVSAACKLLRLLIDSFSEQTFQPVFDNFPFLIRSLRIANDGGSRMEEGRQELVRVLRSVVAAFRQSGAFVVLFSLDFSRNPDFKRVLFADVIPSVLPSSDRLVPINDILLNALKFDFGEGDGDRQTASCLEVAMEYMDQLPSGAFSIDYTAMQLHLASFVDELRARYASRAFASSALVFATRIWNISVSKNPGAASAGGPGRAPLSPRSPPMGDKQQQQQQQSTLLATPQPDGLVRASGQLIKQILSSPLLEISADCLGAFMGLYFSYAPSSEAVATGKLLAQKLAGGLKTADKQTAEGVAVLASFFRMAAADLDAIEHAVVSLGSPGALSSSSLSSSSSSMLLLLSPGAARPFRSYITDNVALFLPSLVAYLAQDPRPGLDESEAKIAAGLYLVRQSAVASTAKLIAKGSGVSGPQDAKSSPFKQLPMLRTLVWLLAAYADMPFEAEPSIGNLSFDQILEYFGQFLDLASLQLGESPPASGSNAAIAVSKFCQWALFGCKWLAFRLVRMSAANASAPSPSMGIFSMSGMRPLGKESGNMAAPLVAVVRSWTRVWISAVAASSSMADVYPMYLEFAEFAQALLPRFVSFAESHLVSRVRAVLEFAEEQSAGHGQEPNLVARCKLILDHARRDPARAVAAAQLKKILLFQMTLGVADFASCSHRFFFQPAGFVEQIVGQPRP